MNPLWTLLFVLSAPRGVLSQVRVRESGPSLMKPSQTLSLTCTVSGSTLHDVGVGWVRQAPGKAVEWIASIGGGGSTAYNAALKSRLSVVKDDSTSQVSLSLSNVSPEETGTYYCVKYRCNTVAALGLTCGAGDDAWGQGLLVSVASASTTAPK
nr:immunoglobulin gamma heavy chain [Bos taurus]